MRNTFLILTGILIFTACSMEQKTSNPFLSDYNTPHNTAPFDKIEVGHYLPAVEEGIKQGKAEVDAIVNNSEEATFENTIEALEQSGELLNKVTLVFYNMLSAETSDTLQKIAQQVSPMLTEFSNDINLNPELFKRVKAVYEKKDELDLTTEQNTLLENTYVGFVRRGANLSDEDKEKFRKISTELSKLTLQFGNNVLAETNAYELHLINEEDLSGLPEGEIEAAKGRAVAKGKEKGWVIDLTYPSYGPFMKYADNRELRKQLYMAYATKGNVNNENDNRDILKRIVELRLETAKLLGYNNYADYVLERRMAGSADAVYQLLEDLYAASMPVAEMELEELNKYAKSTGFKDREIKPWDFSYYAEKLKDEKYSISDEVLKPYFELSNVTEGVFGLATELYGIKFVENKDIPVYHEEVKAYEVFDENGEFLSVFYTDFHPRESKRGGAWMSNFKEQWKEGSKDSRPHVMIVMNFTKPTETKPSLLTFREVETFLHEFGHALHGMLAKGEYMSLSGTNVYRDFVELPSQIMENWAVEKEFLDRFAVHYETGEKIPEDLVEKIKASNNYHAGYSSVRQLSFGFLDMAWHTVEEPVTDEVEVFEDKAWAKTQLFDNIPGSCMSTQFNHLFAGGYAAGYYGYKWAEVLDADAFSVFKEKGLFDKETATAFRKNILEMGGTEDPMELYVKFRGQKPTIDALLERSGMKN